MKLITTTAALLMLQACASNHQQYVSVDTINHDKYTRMQAELIKFRQPVYISHKKDVELLKDVNDYVNNHISYTNEPANADIWQTPYETEYTGKGDCEDYAVYKHELLKQNGMNPKDLHILVGKTKQGEEHAVLEVKLNKRTYYLDNRDNYLTGNTIYHSSYKINDNGMNILK